MPRFRLEILQPRAYHVGKNADGTDRFFQPSAGDVKKHFETVKRMLQAQVQVPVCFNHDKDIRAAATPQDRERLALQKTPGRLESVEMSGDTLYGHVEIPGETDAAILRSVRFCSPRIEPKFTDGYGRKWENAITHVAITPRPRHHEQAPAAELGFIDLAVDGEDGKDVEEEDKEKKPPETPPEGSTRDEKVQRLAEAMKAAGYTIPDEVKDIDDLIIAFKAGAGVGAAGAQKPEEPTGQVVEGAEKPLVMSLDQQTKKAAALARQDLKRRAEQLFTTGRVTRPIADDLKKEADAIQLGFDDKGEVAANGLTLKLAAYEALPAGASFAARQDDESRRRMNPAYAVLTRDVELSLKGGDGLPADTEILAEWDKV